MGDSREESPDWVRAFQPPTRPAIELSSESETPLDNSPESEEDDNVNLSRLFKKEAKPVSDIKDDDDVRETLSDSPVKGKAPSKGVKIRKTPQKTRKKDDTSARGKRAKVEDKSGGNTPENLGKSHEENPPILSLSSDSESSPDVRPIKKSKTNKKESSASKDFDLEDKKEHNDILLNNDVKSQKDQPPNVKSPMRKLEKEDENSFNFKEQNISSSLKEDNDMKDNPVKEDIPGKRPGPQVSSSRLPLMLSEKVQRVKALVECEGDSIDLSGDMGSVGRIVITDDFSKKPEMFLDLKGTIYKTTIVPSRTFCVVSFSQSEAKIEAIMNDYIQLKPQSNIYEAETMVEGTLEGFSFDSEEEGDKPNVEADQLEAAEEQPDGKTKTKTNTKPGLTKKKGKPAGEKALPKKVKKKPQVSKKGKTKK